ncbi:MAG: hypothetical protein ABSH19_07420 [Opitutales bacterium]|jgi:hypothetical protein
MISRRTWWALALFPLAFFAVNRTWMYSTIDNADAWKCTGYFVHPEMLYARFAGAYQGSRVLHNGLGWLAYRWLPVAWAIFAQKAALFAAGFWFLFGALHRLFRNERAALAGAALGLTNGLAIYNLSWNYVFGTCLVLMLGAVWALTRMRDARRLWGWQMLAGTLFTGAVCTYLAQAAVAPLVFALFVFCLPRWTWAELAKGLGWAAAGAAGAVILQGIISHGFGGPWWFFLAQVHAIGRYTTGTWDLPIAVWWRDARWLPFYLLVLVLAAGAVWKGGRVAYRSSADRPVGVWASLAGPLPLVSWVFIAGLAGFAVCDALGQWQFLQNEGQASLLLTFPLLVVGGWLAWLMEGMEERKQWAVVAAGLGTILVVYGLPEKPSGYLALGLIPVLVAAAGVGAEAKAGRALVCTLGFVVSLAGRTIDLCNKEQTDPRRLAANVAENEAVFAAVKRLDEWQEAGQAWFWFNLGRSDGWFASRLADFYLYGSSVAGEKFPAASNWVGGSDTNYSQRPFFLRPGMRVVLFSPTAEEILKAEMMLASHGLRLKQLAQTEVSAGARLAPMTLELWEVVPIQRGLAVEMDLSQAVTAAGVTRAAGGEFIYPAGEKEPLWQLNLPEGLAPGMGKPPGLLHARIGGNARRLRLILADSDGKTLKETLVDPGTEVLDAWVALLPGADARTLLVRPAEAGVGGSFVVDGVEE